MDSKNRESTKPTQNEFLPLSTVSPEIQDCLLKMANGISKVAGKVEWFKQPAMSEFELVAEICTISGYYCLQEVMDALASGPGPLYMTLASERPAWARIFQEVLDSKAPSVETNSKPASFDEARGYRHLERN